MTQLYPQFEISMQISAIAHSRPPCNGRNSNSRRQFQRTRTRLSSPHQHEATSNVFSRHGFHSKPPGSGLRTGDSPSWTHVMERHRLPVVELDDHDEDDLKPLFDYSDTVHPATEILSSDDSDDEAFVVVKSSLSKRKLDLTPPTEPFTPKPERDQAQKAALDDDDDDDDSWMMISPSKLPKLASVNSAVQQLRFQRRELEILQQKTTREAINRVEELARTRAQRQRSEPPPQPPVVVVKTAPKSSLNSREESLGSEAAASEDKEKILLKVQNNTQSTQSIRIFKTDNFSKLFKIYADLTKLRLENMVFRFDGDQISPLSTPKELDMDDDDIVEVYFKS